MTQPNLAVAVAETTVEENDKIRWRWFAFGCICLIAGSFYLSTVELGAVTNFEEDQVESATVVDTAQTLSR